MSPSDLEILIHCYCKPEPHPRLTASAVQETLSKFEDDEIIFYVGKGVYKTTQKGEVWLASILDTPYPKLQWVDARSGKVLKAD